MQFKLAEQGRQLGNPQLTRSPVPIVLVLRHPPPPFFLRRPDPRTICGAYPTVFPVAPNVYFGDKTTEARTMSGRTRLPAGEPRKASQRHTRRGEPLLYPHNAAMAHVRSCPLARQSGPVPPRSRRRERGGHN